MSFRKVPAFFTLTTNEGGNAKPSDEDIVQLLAVCEELSQHVQVRPVLTSAPQHVLQPEIHTHTHMQPAQQAEQ